MSFKRFGVFLLAAILVAGCASAPQQNPYLYTGAGLGAALGAAIGAGVNHSNPWKGAASGGLLGGVTGGVAGEAYGRSSPYYQPGYPPPAQGQGYYGPSQQPNYSYAPSPY
jgi:hypothetical protein